MMVTFINFIQAEEYQVCAFGMPTMYKLVKSVPETFDIEEATFTIHGIILDKELLPIRIDKYVILMIEMTISYLTSLSHSVRDNGSKQRYAGYIRQYIALTGLGLEEFNQVLMGLARAHKYFEDFLPLNKLELLEPFTINGNLALACHT